MTVTTEQDFLHYVLSGLTGFVVEGYDEILVIDLRDYPSRSVEEPDKDKVLRGSRDGFVEAIMPNIALIRRRIRDVDLKFEIYSIGSSSRTDISVAVFEYGAYLVSRQTVGIGGVVPEIYCTSVF